MTMAKPVNIDAEHDALIYKWVAVGLWAVAALVVGTTLLANGHPTWALVAIGVGVFCCACAAFGKSRLADFLRFPGRLGELVLTILSRAP